MCCVVVRVWCVECLDLWERHVGGCSCQFRLLSSAVLFSCLVFALPLVRLCVRLFSCFYRLCCEIVHTAHPQKHTLVGTAWNVYAMEDEWNLLSAVSIIAKWQASNAQSICECTFGPHKVVDIDAHNKVFSTHGLPEFRCLSGVTIVSSTCTKRRHCHH